MHECVEESCSNSCLNNTHGDSLNSSWHFIRDTIFLHCPAGVSRCPVVAHHSVMREATCFTSFVLCSDVFWDVRNAKNTMKTSALLHPEEGYCGAPHIRTLGTRGCWYGIYVIEHNKPFTPDLRTVLLIITLHTILFCTGVEAWKWYIYVIFIQMLNETAAKSVAWLHLHGCGVNESCNNFTIQKSGNLSMEKYLIKGKMPCLLTKRTNKNLEKGEEWEMSVSAWQVLLKPAHCSVRWDACIWGG